MLITIFSVLLLNSTHWQKAQFSQLSDAELLNGLKDNWVGLAVTLIVLGIGVFTTFFGKSKPKGCLDPKKFKEFKLVKRTKLTHNTDRFRFALPTPTSVLGLPVGQHIRCRGKDSEGKQVVRPYTPITLDSDVGYFELVVKMYPKGRMSHHFRQMKEGDFLPVLGPVGRFRYCAGQARAFGMLAGGTGITPMFQVTRAILENPKDKTKIYLIYANHTVDDILLKDDLDNFSHEYPDSFKVYYVVNEAPANWNGGVGHISKEMVQEHCPRPAPDIMVLRCGPPGMNKAMAAYLNELGYTPEMQFEF